MPRYLFITGKLAEPALREALVPLAEKVGFNYEVTVLNITVAALMTPEWVARRLVVPEGIEHIYVPGACTGDWSILSKAVGVNVTAGPADVRDLPDLFGQVPITNYGEQNIDIIAEINHAPKLSTDELLRQAKRFQSEGADVTDLGCIPGSIWKGIGDAVKMLRDAGLRVSVDSFQPDEVQMATRAGAELVLSVNSSNREACRDWGGCEVVVIPDTPSDVSSLADTIEYLEKHRVKFRIDPILEPIGYGFGASLIRYHEARRRYPNCEMMMGIGNLTELTEVDSAAVNLLLLSLCQEWGIRSVLTTAVANFARSSVRECALGRQLAHYAVEQKRLPKKVNSKLLTLRDRKLHPMGEKLLSQLASSITDPNYRLFADEGKLHAINGSMHVSDTDPFLLFEKIIERDPSIDSSHAFYLGYELSKALLALQLSKNYVQDQSLNWGFLTIPEISHRERQRQLREERDDR